MSDFDDFPKGLVPKKTSPRKHFAFGEEDDTLEQPEEELNEDLDQAEPLTDEEGQVIPAIPEVARTNYQPLVSEPEISPVDAAAIGQRLLEDPAIATLANITSSRFGKVRTRVDESSRVTRSWLYSLSQRDFFLAIGYPGAYIHKLMDGMTSIGRIRSWVDGLETVPQMERKVLTLEHLLDRRTMANRDRMPSRKQIEDALRAMPSTAAVSEVVGGFEGFKEEPKMGEDPIARGSANARDVAGMLKIVKPGDKSDNGSRRGAALPMNARLRGEGRPLGQRLLKPNTYCYKISKQSVDDMGNPRITPQEAMEYINKTADLEIQYGVYYSLRRRFVNKPWTLDNLEMIPTEQLEKERGATLRMAKDED